MYTIFLESFDKGCSKNLLKPSPKPGRDLCKLNGYHTLTIQNTTGNLMKRIVARNLVRNLEDKVSQKNGSVVADREMLLATKPRTSRHRSPGEERCRKRKLPSIFLEKARNGDC